MQDETTTSGETQQQSLSDVNHQYYEVGREILSKPTLLCDIVESQEVYPILIYCNTPSDTDFVEVMLKKRGINSQKLIGNVPQEKIDATYELIKNNQLSAVVLTDIAARLIDLSAYGLVINYSSPQDSDTYLERCGLNKTKTIKNVLTLVSPLELANFHFIKKGLAINPEIAPPPSQENIAKARFRNLKNEALKCELVNAENIQSMAKLISEDADKDKIISLLLHNTLNILPSAKSSGQKPSEQTDFDDKYDQQERGGKWNNRGSKDRNGRRERGGRGRYGSADRGDNNKSESDYDSGPDYNEENQSHDKRGSRNGRGPVKKDARIYLSKGTDKGFNRENILSLIGRFGLSEESLKHLSIRKNYTFFDIEDEKSAEVIEALKEESKDTAVKAITINSLVKGNPESDSQSEQEDAGTTGDSGDRDFEHSEEEGDNIGNR